MLIKQMFSTSMNLQIKRNMIKRIIPIISNNSIKKTIKMNDIKKEVSEEVSEKKVKKVFYPFFGWVFY